MGPVKKLRTPDGAAIYDDARASASCILLLNLRTALSFLVQRLPQLSSCRAGADHNRDPKED